MNWNKILEKGSEIKESFVEIWRKIYVSTVLFVISGHILLKGHKSVDPIFYHPSYNTTNVHLKCHNSLNVQDQNLFDFFWNKPYKTNAKADVNFGLVHSGYYDI